MAKINIPVLIWDNNKIRETTDVDYVMVGSELQINNTVITTESSLEANRAVLILIGNEMYKLLLHTTI